jgi:HTH-type transcriptional regulator/antitoxin HigA
MQKKITTKTDYKSAIKIIDNLMAKGEAHLAKKEQQQLKDLATAVEKFEDENLPLPKPKTLVGMIQLKMFELKLKQKQLADILNIPESRVSEMMKGKRKITLPIAQKLYEKLDIPADFILENA